MNKCLLITILLSCSYIKPEVWPIASTIMVPVTPCDKQYTLDMQYTLNNLKSALRVDLMQIAEEYMILIKQHRDLEYKIRIIERQVINSAIAAQLRGPLERYTRCQDNMREKSIY